jgi:hypothetical protein
MGTGMEIASANRIAKNTLNRERRITNSRHRCLAADLKNSAQNKALPRSTVTADQAMVVYGHLMEMQS